MTEFNAIIGGVGILMFYLHFYSLQFKTDELDDSFSAKFLGWVRLFYSLMSMLLAFLLAFIIYDIANNLSAPASTLAGLTTNIWLFGIIMLLTAVFMAVYMLIVVPETIFRALKEFKRR